MCLRKALNFIFCFELVYIFVFFFISYSIQLKLCFFPFLRYFKCKSNHGLFAPLLKVKLAELPSSNTTKLLSNINSNDSNIIDKTYNRLIDVNTKSTCSVKIITDNKLDQLPYNSTNTFIPIQNNNNTDDIHKTRAFKSIKYDGYDDDENTTKLFESINQNLEKISILKADLTNKLLLNKNLNKKINNDTNNNLNKSKYTSPLIKKTLKKAYENRSSSYNQPQKTPKHQKLNTQIDSKKKHISKSTQNDLSQIQAQTKMILNRFINTKNTTQTQSTTTTSTTTATSTAAQSLNTVNNPKLISSTCSTSSSSSSSTSSMSGNIPPPSNQAAQQKNILNKLGFQLKLTKINQLNANKSSTNNKTSSTTTTTNLKIDDTVANNSNKIEMNNSNSSNNSTQTQTPTNGLTGIC